MKSITWKFPRRRKVESFVIYPADGEKVVIQSNKTIAQINLKTGRGMLNATGSDNKYFMHLNEFMGAKPYKFSKNLIDKIRGNTPKSGDEIGGGVYFA